MISETEIHKMATSKEVDRRFEVVKFLEGEFYNLENKPQAWQDLIGLINDEDVSVRKNAGYVLCLVFSHIPNKEQSWQDLINLTKDDKVFSRLVAACAMGSAFPHINDKDLAWKDFYRLIQDDNSQVRWGAAYAIGLAFPYSPDRNQAWEDLINLTKDNCRDVQLKAVDSLSSAFPYTLDKDQAWQDLLVLSNNDHNNVRLVAIDALRLAIPYVLDKDQAWLDLRRLTQDKNNRIRENAVYALGLASLYITDKEQAWQDLIRLVKDNDVFVRLKTANALGSVYSYVPNKEMVWQDLIKLIKVDEGFLGWMAINTLGLVFQYVPDKQQAWQDLLKQTNDHNSYNRWGVIDALGLAFPYVPHKEQAWQDLISLAHDEDPKVKCFSYYALGRASIFNATEAESIDDFRDQMEKAIKFFDLASDAVSYLSRADFCLPFYRSLYSILFNTSSKEAEIKNYLAEARQAVRGSESREILLEIVENLSKALQEVKSYTVEDMAIKRRGLKAYMRYCIQASECLRDVRDKAPFASKIVDYVAVEKSFLILDDKIKNLLRDVEEAAKQFCRNSTGTDLEEIGRYAYKTTRGLGFVKSPLAADRYLEEIVPLLKGHCSQLPKEAQVYLRILIDSQDTATIEQRFETLKSVLLASLVQSKNDAKRAQEYEGLLAHINGVEFSVSRLSLSSGDARLKLNDLQFKMNVISSQIKAMDLRLDELGYVIEEKDRVTIESMEKTKLALIRVIEKEAKELPSKEEIERILKQVQGLKQSKARDLLSLVGDLYTLFDLARALIALIRLIPT